MRKALVLPLVALAVALPAGWAFAAENDVKGPACGDMVTVLDQGSEVVYAGDGTVAATFLVGAASCRSVTYTVHVTNEESGSAVTASTRGDGDAFNADGTDFVHVSTTTIAGDTNNTVCAFLTTTNNGGRLLDRAPDTGCVPLTKGGGAAGGGMN